MGLAWGNCIAIMVNVNLAFVFHTFAFGDSLHYCGWSSDVDQITYTYM